MDGPAWGRLGLGVLGEYVPTAVIDEVLTATGRFQQRIRRLPARVTVLFVLALTLFADLGYRSVWRELAHSGASGGIDGGIAGDPPSSSGLAQARRRVGLAPLAALFAWVRPDSDANTAAFIRSRN